MIYHVVQYCIQCVCIYRNGSQVHNSLSISQKKSHASQSSSLFYALQLKNNLKLFFCPGLVLTKLNHHLHIAYHHIEPFKHIHVSTSTQGLKTANTSPQVTCSTQESLGEREMVRNSSGIQRRTRILRNSGWNWNFGKNHFSDCSPSSLYECQGYFFVCSLTRSYYRLNKAHQCKQSMCSLKNSKRIILLLIIIIIIIS